MVILHISSIANDSFSGVSVVVPQYIKGQAKSGHIVALLNVSGIRIKGMEEWQLKTENKIVIDELEKPFNRPDLVVFHECYRKAYIGIWPQLKKRGIPYVVLPHGELGEAAQRKKWLKKKVANLLLFNRFVNNAVAVQCLSKREIETTYFGKKKILATNGVDIPEMSKKLFSKSCVKITYIGRLDAYHKGLDLLIGAVASIHNRLSGVEVNIFGPDIYGRKAHLEELVKRFNVEDVVRIHPEVTGQEEQRIIMDTDIFIQTSRFEGMPLGLLEAMSYGIPCIASEGTTLAEEIEKAEAGWNAGACSETIAETIVRAVEERAEWKRFGLNGRALIADKYSWDVVTRGTISEYSKLLLQQKVG